MPYFVVETDADLIEEKYRRSNELARVAAEVEEDVIGYYTRPKPSTADGWRAAFPAGVEVDADLLVYVYLAGYKVDAEDPDVNARLKQELKRTIAEVIEWRLGRGDRAVESESKVDGKKVTYRPSASELFPPDWDRRLRKFDTFTDRGVAI